MFLNPTTLCLHKSILNLLKYSTKSITGLCGPSWLRSCNTLTSTLWCWDCKNGPPPLAHSQNFNFMYVLQLIHHNYLQPKRVNKLKFKEKSGDDKPPQTENFLLLGHSAHTKTNLG